jgi:hypothetical protein
MAAAVLGDPQIAGKTATLDGRRHTRHWRSSAALSVSFSRRGPVADSAVGIAAHSSQVQGLSPFLTIFGRLKPGVTLAQANAELKVIRRQYAMAIPTMLDAKPKTPVEVTAMKDDLVEMCAPCFGCFSARWASCC